MPRVAVLQPPGGEVKAPHEERHEHAGVVVPAEERVDAGDDLVRRKPHVRRHAETRTRQKCEQRRRDALARSIAHCEIEQSVLLLEVVEIPPDLSRGAKNGPEVRRHLALQHARLDRTRDAQLAADPLVGHRRALETRREEPRDEEDEPQAND